MKWNLILIVDEDHIHDVISITIILNNSRRISTAGFSQWSFSTVRSAKIGCRTLSLCSAQWLVNAGDVPKRWTDRRCQSSISNQSADVETFSVSFNRKITGRFRLFNRKPERIFNFWRCCSRESEVLKCLLVLDIALTTIWIPDLPVASSSFSSQASHRLEGLHRGQAPFFKNIWSMSESPSSWQRKDLSHRPEFNLKSPCDFFELSSSTW